MKNCSHCHAPLSFGDVVKSVNPTRIRCSNCKAKTPVKLLPVVVLVVLTSLVSVAVVVATIANTLVMLVALTAVALGGEYVYYRLMRAGYLE
ncbi:hypothetical protein [Gilvimarinus agarilyticus]|uniref:hypothetical protein n=1 Tax=Gilvimarinus agarilyticus TaxID=679259 RepID=UPI0005A301DC|nr:hypothetical protein [Gilvimarinus agarilyticus]